MPEIASAYSSFKPKLVAQWEKHAAHADSHEQAQTQLAYDLLVELRTMRVLLVWVLVVVPVVAAVALIVLVSNLQPEDTTGF